MSAPQPEVARVAVKWFDNLLSRSIAEVEDYYAKFRISDALMTIYRLFWDSYCSWYLELVKPPYGEAVDGRTYEATVTFFDKLLKLIHPVMPFISEELWQSMEERREGETIMFQRTPLAGPVDENFLEDFVSAQGAVNGVRAIRAQKQISPKKELELYISGGLPSELFPIISKLANVKILEGEAEGGQAHSWWELSNSAFRSAILWILTRKRSVWRTSSAIRRVFLRESAKSSLTPNS